jgi:hypothetical protein
MCDLCMERWNSMLEEADDITRSRRRGIHVDRSSVHSCDPLALNRCCSLHNTIGSSSRCAESHVNQYQSLSVPHYYRIDIECEKSDSLKEHGVGRVPTKPELYPVTTVSASSARNRFHQTEQLPHPMVNSNTNSTRPITTLDRPPINTHSPLQARFHYA